MGCTMLSSVSLVIGSVSVVFFATRACQRSLIANSIYPIKMSWRYTAQNVVSKSCREDQDSVLGVTVHFRTRYASMTRRKPLWIPSMSELGVPRIQEALRLAQMAASDGQTAVVTREATAEAINLIFNHE